MPSVRNRILLIGPWDPALREVGATLKASLADANLEKGPFDVVALTATALLEKRFPATYEQWRAENPCLQLIATVPPGLATAKLIEMHHQHSLFRVLSGFSATEAETALYEALEKASRLRQDLEMEKLLLDQESRLKSLREELEGRVEKRTSLLAESRHNLHQRNLRHEGLRRALLAVQESTSLPEMERLLSEALVATVETAWIRIVASPQDTEFEKQINAMDGFAWLAVPLWRHQERIGTGFFMRAKDRPFRRDDSEFLRKVCEAVSLALDRLNKLRESETLKEQWDATFSAISDPMAIIDAKYDIVQANTKGDEENPSRKCYERFFGRKDVCPGCSLGEPFQIEQGGRVFEVHSQLLSLESHKEPYAVNLYTDVTERVRMERRILESAKMAELGTVGSSIAHELNNPLGGVLNFAQLIRMDMTADHPFQADLQEIENGARRCKEIVENLLGFSRSPRLDEIVDLDLREVCQRALKIVDLQTRSRGIEVSFHCPLTPVPWRGHRNLLAQAIKNVLQFSIDAVLEHMTQKPEPRGRIDLRLDEHEESYILYVYDNGDEASLARHGVGLSVAGQILHDAGAKFETEVPSSPDCRAKISFSRPVLRS